MWLMALETTSAHGSLALLEDGTERAAVPLEAGRYSTELLGAMDALAGRAGLKLEQMDAWAVASGPGSFTGVRIGLTAVKGFVEVWHRPAVAVSTLAAVAEAAAENGEPLLAALDAARGEIYFGLYPPGEEGLESAAAFAARARGSGRRVATPHETVAALCAGARVRLVPRQLAPAVGRLAWERLRNGGGSDALRLDANYVRRSDAEIFHRS
ncbi:MAG TPA: tRNA (adenosine(37)-N6)-threonylcarbamoyltransferase complex dimerization subunit type 1 TsaB [Terriglobales bacterium]|nr:tRNA (adenosine(37)-N6)-threonylcarbamoyltransferase complex dimerization subunit type 1 TsaB [Terriglobales bacterium]